MGGGKRFVDLIGKFTEQHTNWMMMKIFKGLVELLMN